MRGFFEGRDAQLLTDEKNCPDIRVWHMKMEEAELAHMACCMEESLYFLYVLRGSVDCSVNQEKTEVRQGEGLFIGQKNIWRFTGSRLGSCELYLMEFTLSYLEGNDRTAAEKYVYPLVQSADFPYLKMDGSSIEQEKILEYLRMAGESTQSKRMCFELELKSQMYRIWAELYKEFARTAPSRRKAVLREKEKLYGMVGFLHEHYREKITLAQMADNSGVSSGEYCRFFKRRMNQTPVEYLQLYRIEQSLPEILEKSASITEISLKHGFTGSSYYAETFRKEMGCTPGDYRRWYCHETSDKCPLRKKVPEAAHTASQASRRDSMPAHLL